MTVMSSRRCLTDRLTLVEIIRNIFSRSPVFREALISEPRVGPEGEVIVEVSFDHDPAAFRVVAPSQEEAYAILHELASAMVEIERSRNGRNGKAQHDRVATSADFAG